MGFSRSDAIGSSTRFSSMYLEFDFALGLVSPKKKLNLCSSNPCTMLPLSGLSYGKQSSLPSRSFKGSLSSSFKDSFLSLELSQRTQPVDSFLSSSFIFSTCPATPTSSLEISRLPSPMLSGPLYYYSQLACPCVFFVLIASRSCISLGENYPSNSITPGLYPPCSC